MQGVSSVEGTLFFCPVREGARGKAEQSRRDGVTHAGVLRAGGVGGLRLRGGQPHHVRAVGRARDRRLPARGKDGAQ